MVPGSEITGRYGINIHNAGTGTKTAVSKWSAGCTVLSNLREWDIFMAVVNRSAEIYGDTFTYTLIED